MAERDKSSGITTLYEEAAGTLVFTRREEIDAEVLAYIDIINQLKADYADDPQVVTGLADLESSLSALRVSTESEEALQQKLQSLVEVPIAEGKALHLNAFRKSTATTTLKDSEAYRARVKKLVANTEGNLTHLLITWPDDNILQRFLKDLTELDMDGEIGQIKAYMDPLGKSPHLWHYSEKKKEFLVEWLRPFQEQFGKPIEQFSEEELQASIQKVEQLRNTKLEEMTHLMVDSERAAFRPYNRKMHPIMNGKNEEFWGNPEVCTEFIALMNKLITRFSLNLDERFLLFKTKDEGFAYLVGFADEAFSQAVEMNEGELGIYPHLKVFLKGQQDQYNEIQPEAYAGNTRAYYQALRTAAVPFFSSMAVMLELVLSSQFKEAFDMWT